MFRSLRRTTAPLSAAVLLSLAACGGGQTTAPKPTVAATAAATAAATVAPTAAATAAATAVEATTAEATTAEATTEATTTGEATATTAEATTPAAATTAQPIVVGDLVTYKDKSGIFQIDVPSNWKLEDSSKPDAPSMAWVDPTGSSAVVIDISTDAKTNTPEDLTDLLTKYVAKTFAGAPDLVTNPPKAMSDGSVLISSNVTTPNSNIKLVNNSYIEQRGDKVMIITIAVPVDQFASLSDKLTQIVNSFKITTP